MGFVKAFLVCLAVVTMTKADVLMFDEADFSAPYPLPGPMIDSQGNMFVPLLKGYTVGEWWAATTVVQVLQADVERGSELDSQVDRFMPRDTSDSEDEAKGEQEIVQAVRMETRS
ncbi:uncharacterized protein LOC125028228 [Penaeus chinensis]|uniref:uncharacterized protein LOC125028228 n=1 Tax=Penaeus chinensis TaxID=139456 RepID=UPI001FB85D20|nr:uncharacterized protein LOC125028228 [Penaeus chinensis]